MCPGEGKELEKGLEHKLDEEQLTELEEAQPGEKEAQTKL